jgi:hypothetical protein
MSSLRFAGMILLAVAAFAALAVFETWWIVVSIVALALGLLALTTVEVVRRRGDKTVTDAAQRPISFEPAPQEFITPPAGRQVLLVTTEALDAERVEEALEGEDRQDVYVVVIAPQLIGRRADLWFGGAGEAHPRARWVLDQTIDSLKAVGVGAHGHIGAPDLAAAVTDGLRAYGPDLVVVARRRSDPYRHLEDVPLDDTVGEYGVDLRDIDLSRALTPSH